MSICLGNQLRQFIKSTSQSLHISPSMAQHSNNNNSTCFFISRNSSNDSSQLEYLEPLVVFSNPSELVAKIYLQQASKKEEDCEQINASKHVFKCKTTFLSRMRLAVLLTLLHLFRAYHLSNQKAPQIFTISNQKKVEEVLKRLQNEQKISCRRVKYNLDHRLSKSDPEQLQKYKWMYKIKVSWISSPLLQFQKQWALEWLQDKLGQKCLSPVYTRNKNSQFMITSLQDFTKFGEQQILLAQLLRNQILISNIKELNKIQQHARKHMKCSQKLVHDCFSMPIAYFFTTKHRQQLKNIIALGRRIQNQYYAYSKKISLELLQNEEKEQKEEIAQKKKKKKKKINNKTFVFGDQKIKQKSGLTKKTQNVSIDIFGHSAIQQKEKQQKYIVYQQEPWTPLEGNDQPLLLQNQKRQTCDQKQQQQLDQKTITLSSKSYKDEQFKTPSKKHLYAKFQPLKTKDDLSDHQQCFSRFEAPLNIQQDRTSTSSLTIPREFTPPPSPSQKQETAKIIKTRRKNKTIRLSTQRQFYKGSKETKLIKEIIQATKNKQKQEKNIQNTQFQKTCKQVSNQILTHLLEQKVKQIDMANQNIWHAKNRAIQYVTTLIQCNFPYLQPRMFGSNVTGLALPHSDIDILITPLHNAYMGRQILLELARIFGQFGWVVYCNAITTAKVPVIKLLVDSTVGFMGYSPYRELQPEMFPQHLVHIDVTLNCQRQGNTGVQATMFMQYTLEKRPNIRNLILLMKHILQRRDLNQSYKGGISSYVLFLMVLCSLQYLKINSQQTSLGTLFFTLMKFYCEEFDNTKQVLWYRQGTSCLYDLKQDEQIIKLHNNNVPIKIIDPVNGRQILASFSKISTIINVFNDFLHQEMRLCIKGLDLIQKMINQKIKVNRLKKHLPKQMIETEEYKTIHYLLNL